MMIADVSLRPTELAELVAWLTTIVDRRDLTCPAPDHVYGHDLETLLDTLSAEFRDYREIVYGARDAARRNAEHLAAIVDSAGEQVTLTSEIGAVLTQASTGTDNMSNGAIDLREFAARASESVNEAVSDIEFIDGSLSELSLRISETTDPLRNMRRSTQGVAEFVFTLGRLARHAQLLSVNSSIEAAHLDEAGVRFALVADEVRKLSTSTRDSKAGVERIVAELRDSTKAIAAASTDSQTATNTAMSQMASAGEALTQTATGIERFGEAVSIFSSTAEEQITTLAAISTSIATLVLHAQEAAAASRSAEQLSIDTLLEPPRERVDAWQLRAPQQTRLPTSETDFGRWIAAISAGADPQEPAAVDGDETIAALVSAVRSFLMRVNTEDRAILADIIAAGFAIALDACAWQSINAARDGVREEVFNVREKVAQWVSDANQTIAFASGMRNLIVDSISDQCSLVLKQLDGALAQIAYTTDSVHLIEISAAAMESAAARADEIMTLIDTLSSETALLSFNAAIEAAHVGELGITFSAIADEIRSLARSTNESTTGVSELVATIVANGARLQQSIAAAVRTMRSVVRYAESGRAAILTFRDSFDSAIARAEDLATTAAEQTAAIDRVVQAMNRCAASMEDDPTGEAERGRLRLAIFGSRAHAIAARRPLGTAAERVRAFGETLSVRVEAAIENAVARAGFEPNLMFDFTYRKIEADEVGILARLFDVSLVPESGFKPPKYATPWDAVVDEAVIDVLTAGWNEATALNLAPVRIGAFDLNGFLYAQARQIMSDWTNDAERDRTTNRIKWMFEDDYSFRVCRWGLGPTVEFFGPRCSFDQFRDAGCLLERNGVRPWGIYVYASDTKPVSNELTIGLFVGGLRHGTLRIVYDRSLI